MTASDLHRAVQTTLASKRLGTPVFARYLFHGTGDGPAIVARLARVVATVRGWLDQSLERIHAQGGVAQRHIALTLECRGGATAFVNWIGTPPRGPGIDLTVLGNHGALYHDLGDANAWESANFDDPQPADQALTAWIERALRSGRPEAQS
jgi:hypothetical protein